MEYNNFFLYLMPFITLIIGVLIGIIIPIFTRKPKKEVVLPEFYLEFVREEDREHALKLMSLDALETEALAKKAREFNL